MYFLKSCCKCKRKLCSLTDQLRMSDSYFHKRHYLLVFWITHTFLQINIFSWWKFCVERSWQGGGEGSVSQSVWHSLAPVACFCLAVRIPSSFISPLSRSDQQPKCRNLTESWCSTERIIGQKLKMEKLQIDLSILNLFKLKLLPFSYHSNFK